jgi:UDP-glucuronate 4-epimerase
LGRILVTGAAGFVGSHLVYRLLELGHEVTGLDCFTDYYFRDLKQRNLDRALPHGRFRFFEGDLLRSNLDKTIGGVDKVAHLAGEPGVRSSWGERFSVYVERNVRATQRLLEAASRMGPEQLVLASSSSVYGPDNGGPVAEDDPRRPASPYGLSKLAAEELVGLYAGEHAVPATILRYFTAYGPRQRPEMPSRGSYPRCLQGVRRSLRGRYPESGGDLRLGRRGRHRDRADGEARRRDPHIYNVGGGTRTTVGELAELVGEMSGR